MSCFQSSHRAYAREFCFENRVPPNTCCGGSRCSSAWRSLSNYEELKMSQPEHFEMLILGSGEGGKYLAWHMAKSGHRTAVVERKLIGGP
jgi:hypothetical protein